MLASVGRFRKLSRISKPIDYNYLPLFPTSTSTAALQLQDSVRKLQKFNFPFTSTSEDSVRKLQKFNFPFTSTSDYSVRKLQSNLIIDIDNNFYLNILYKYSHGYEIFYHVLLFFSKRKAFNFCCNLKL